MDPFSVIPMRTSRRSYTNDQLSDEMQKSIQALLETLNHGLFGSEIVFSLISKKEASDKKIKLGTYGFIQGAKHFIVGQVEASKNAFLDYGYCLEHIILELTQMGLGTCWLGGTFDRSEFAKISQLKDSWVIPAITPVGFSTPNRSLGDKVIRVGAGSKKRKNWEELFFEADSLKPLDPDSAGEKTNWLEMLRLAPSASNNQPWRILVGPQHLDLFLSRKPGYQRVFGSVDLQMVDMGIAMCHLDRAANHAAKKANWTQNGSSGTIFDWEYVATLNF